MAIVSLQNNKNKLSKGYYNISVFYSIDDYSQHIYEAKGKVVVAKTVPNNMFTLSGNNLSLVSENGEYTWSVIAIQNIDRQEYTTQVAERSFKVQMEEIETATLNIDNLVIF